MSEQLAAIWKTYKTPIDSYTFDILVSFLQDK